MHAFRQGKLRETMNLWLSELTPQSYSELITAIVLSYMGKGKAHIVDYSSSVSFTTYLHIALFTSP